MTLTIISVGKPAALLREAAFEEAPVELGDAAEHTEAQQADESTAAATLSNARGGGVETANGWYEGEEIYYINHGIEEGVTERGENDIYLIGGDRLYQAQVVEFIPGEPGYSPHWNVNVVHTAAGVKVSDIEASPFASNLEGVLFDDVEDILGAEAAGLVTIEMPGVVVLCPIISEHLAGAVVAIIGNLAHLPINF